MLTLISMRTVVSLGLAIALVLLGIFILFGTHTDHKYKSNLEIIAYINQRILKKDWTFLELKINHLKFYALYVKKDCNFHIINTFSLFTDFDKFEKEFKLFADTDKEYHYVEKENFLVIRYIESNYFSILDCIEEVKSVTTCDKIKVISHKDFFTKHLKKLKVSKDIRKELEITIDNLNAKS